MRRSLFGAAAVVLSGALLAPWLAEAATAFKPLNRVEIHAKAPAFKALGADGKTHALHDYAGKIIVLEWTSPACPYTAMHYTSGAMQALQRDAVKAGIVWLSIDTAAPGKPGYLTPAGAKARIAQTKAQVTAFLFDRDGSIGRLYGAKSTPSVFIIGKDGKLAYQGAFDDYSAPDGEKGRQYARMALDDLKAGRPVQKTEVRPYGCAVEY